MTDRKKSIRQRDIKKYDARLRKKQSLEVLNEQAWELLILMYHRIGTVEFSDMRRRIRELFHRRSRHD